MFFLVACVADRGKVAAARSDPAVTIIQYLSNFFLNICGMTHLG